MTGDVRDYAPFVSPALLPVAATLLALGGIRTGDTVADVGCGAGLLTHPAAAAAGAHGRVYGVDPDPGMLAAAAARRASPVVWVRADAARLPFRDGRVDKVLCGTAHRLADADAEAAVASFARVLAPGGRLAMGAWASFADGQAEEALRSVVPDVRTAPPPLAELARAAGLRVVHEGSDEVAVPFATAASWAAWRVTFLRELPEEEREGVARQVAGLLVDTPVTANGVIHHIAATRS
jgi:SAM-dependent methyltransferase